MDEINKSKNEKVQKLLEEISMVNKEQSQIVEELRQIVLNSSSEIEEKVMYGGIMFSLNDDFGGIFIRKEHVSFEYTHGHLLEDSDNLLEGKGKYRRHLKIRKLEDIVKKKVYNFVNQAILI